MRPGHCRDLIRRVGAPEGEAQVFAGHPPVAAVDKKTKATQGLAKWIRNPQRQVRDGQDNPYDQRGGQQIYPAGPPFHPFTSKETGRPNIA